MEEGIEMLNVGNAICVVTEISHIRKAVVMKRLTVGQDEIRKEPTEVTGRFLWF